MHRIAVQPPIFLFLKHFGTVRVCAPCFAYLPLIPLDVFDNKAIFGALGAYRGGMIEPSLLDRDMPSVAIPTSRMILGGLQRLGYGP